ncbi:MAG TPA: PilZ domain-containing protein [Methylomirabilota bacterium]|nr:PilZ domain-containing protein [Methylomirabilota bacterium]
MSGHDRRAFPRAAAAWPATVESGEGRVVSGEVVNLSLSGMKVRAESDAGVGGIVTVRVALPGAAGRIEMVGTVVRRDAESLGVAFLKMSDSPAGRVTPFVSRGDTRRRFPRVLVSLPILVEGGSEGTARGHTVDLSASGGRVTTDAPLVEGDVVVIELPARAGIERLRLPALVWESYAGGAVLVFANLAPKEFTRLREYLASCQPRGSRASSV